MYNPLIIVKKFRNVLCKNKAKVLTCASAIGVVATAGVSVRAGMNIQKKIDEDGLTKTDILKELAPVAVTVAATEVSLIAGYKTSAKTIATQAVEIMASKKQYDALEKKLRESVGDEKAQEIIKENNDKELESKATAQSSKSGSGYEWFRDEFSGAAFLTTENDIWKAWTRAVVKPLQSGDQVSLKDFYYDITRCDQTGTDNFMVKEFGWDGRVLGDCNAMIDTNDIYRLHDGTPCRRIKYLCVPPHVLADWRMSR